MNLAIRGIDANLGPRNADSFRADLHPDLKADFILANPPFNMSDWGGENLRQEPTLKNIARELVSHVRKIVTIDWTLRESAQAQIRVLVRRILRKYDYPPDKQEKATQTVLEQAKLLCGDWAEAS